MYKYFFPSRGLLIISACTCFFPEKDARENLRCFVAQNILDFLRFVFAQIATLD